MDTITQAALGACIAQAGFSNKLGKRAVLVGAACGLLPDFDILLTIGSSDFDYLQSHRGWSHSFLTLPFIAIIVAWLAVKLASRPNSTLPPQNNFKYWYLLSFFTLITHPLLDLFTTYGTQILSPFSTERFSLDAIAIIDPLYTVPLLLAVLTGMFIKAGKLSKLLAICALILSSGYLSFGVVNSHEAKQAAIAQLDTSSFSAEDVRVSATMFNTLLWRVVAKDEEGHYVVGFYNSIKKNKIHFEHFKNEDSSYTQRALNSDEGKVLNWFSTDMIKASVEELENGNKLVTLTDMRYGMASNPVASFFAWTFEVDANEITKIYPADSGTSNITPQVELQTIWSEIGLFLD